MEYYLMYRLGKVSFVVETERVLLVSLVPELVDPPSPRKGVLGLFYAGERLVPLVDLNWCIFGKEAGALWESYVIVFEDVPFGGVVDRIDGFLDRRSIESVAERVDEGVVGRFVEKAFSAGGKTYFYVNPERVYGEVVGEAFKDL